MSSFGKNVRKYAEVGFQRLVVALPSKLSPEELEEYVALVSKVCEKCQVWFCVLFEFFPFMGIVPYFLQFTVPCCIDLLFNS